MADDETPWSANMDVRTELFKYNAFDPSMGATEDGGYLGDEVKYVKSLRSRGMPGVWVPRARVQHRIVKEGLNRRYVWKHFDRGRRTDWHSVQVPHVGIVWGGVPRWLFRKVVECWVLAHWKRAWRRSDWLLAYTLHRVDLRNDRGSPSGHEVASTETIKAARSADPRMKRRGLPAGLPPVCAEYESARKSSGILDQRQVDATILIPNP